MGYKEYYKEKLEAGLEFQDFVYDVLYQLGLPIVGYSSRKYQLNEGENKAGIEIKYDDRYKETGNLYIETAEKSDPANPTYIASGIHREDNAWLYLIGDYDVFYLFSVRHLRMVEGRYKHVVKGTSKGFLLPEQAAQKLAIRIVEAGILSQGGHIREVCTRDYSTEDQDAFWDTQDVQDIRV